MNTDPEPAVIEAVRRFNRFYTRQIGLLQEGLLRSPYSLTEARVLFEIAQREQTTATALCLDLGLDPGYLSRILRRFQKQGLVDKSPSPSDARQSLITLTERGRDTFSRLDADSRNEVARLLGEMPVTERQKLTAAMQSIERLLGGTPAASVPYILRPHRPGDMGWVISRHAMLYNQEYGWDERFEGLVAGIAARFIDEFDPRRERCWIAEREGENVGSVFLVRHPDHPAEEAKLRMLLVEPSARGLGIGQRLVDECIRFARQVGYRRISLWTNDILHAARAIYEARGFKLVDREAHHSFGVDLIGENWLLAL